MPPGGEFPGQGLADSLARASDEGVGGRSGRGKSHEMILALGAYRRPAHLTSGERGLWGDVTETNDVEQERHDITEREE